MRQESFEEQQEDLDPHRREERDGAALPLNRSRIEHAKRLERSRPEQTGIPCALVREALERCPAKRKLLVLDCCHAGAARGAATPPRWS